MHDYTELKKTHGSRISQTLDSPIMFADIWELSEILWSLTAILIFGILFYSWILMSLSLLWTLILSPIFKKSKNKGFILHYPYRKFGMSLPGLVNPKGNRKYSD